MKKRMDKYLPYVLGTCLLAVVACGSDDDDSGSGRAGGGGPQQQQETEGTYRATLAPIPLNNSVAGNPTGQLEVVIEGDEVKATMNMSGVPGGIRHAQHIMLGTSCPTASNDANQDNFVDVLEGVPNYGLILIPLDGDLEDQDDGASGFPLANSAGTYSYSRTGSLTRMLADLQDADVDLEDGLGKLDGNDLNLEGKVVIVHGVNPTSNLPDSVATIDDFRSHQSLPIACGVIERVEEDTTTTGTTTAGTTDTTTAGTTTGTTADTTTAGTTGTTGTTATGTTTDGTTGTTGTTATGTTTDGTTGTTGTTATGTTTVTPTTTTATNG